MPPYAKIELKRGEIRAPQFDDIYFCKGNGIAESEYVFLEGNGLPQHWQEKSNYCIVEAGFGTGLNFLVSAQAWLDDPARCETLDYFSIEAFPIERNQLKEIHAHWPDFKALSQTLIEQYPPTNHGCHSLCFAAGKLRLHLIFDTLENALDRYTLHPDCWFLDGFAPSKNPSMWQKETLLKIGECSKTNTRLATFTAAGQVRRDLIEAGFEVSKRKGFGRKREMLCALKSRKTPSRRLIKHAPWFSLKHIGRNAGDVSVIGAGIAGAQIAYHLAQNGLKVCVIDSAADIATGASGNIAGVLAPKLSASRDKQETFYLNAFLYQLNQIRSLVAQGHRIGFAQNGLLQLAHNKAIQKRFEQQANRTDLPAELLKIISANEVSKLLGECVEHPAMKIDLAGTLSPRDLCQALLEHPNIECQLGVGVDKIIPTGESHTLVFADGSTRTDHTIVIANGHQATLFSDSINLIPVRGQTSTATLNHGRTVISTLGHAGYVMPASQDPQNLIFGATYQRGERTTELKARDTKTNFESLQGQLPELARHLTDVRDSHAAIRASTLDRWPIVGPLPDRPFFLEAYSDLARGKQFKAYRNAQYIKGLYVLSGLGSRGLTSAGYCANLLTHMILGRAPPAPHSHLHAMHSARFLIRSLKKNL